MPMAGSAVAANLMLVVCRSIIGMMFGLRVATLANARPGRIVLGECKMLGIELKQRRLGCS